MSMGRGRRGTIHRARAVPPATVAGSMPRRTRRFTSPLFTLRVAAARLPPVR